MDGEFLSLALLVKPPGWPKRISVFPRLLAVGRSNRASKDIQSGFDLDDPAALSASEEAGGLVFAQKLDMKRLSDLLSNSVDTACVGRPLALAAIAARLGSIGLGRVCLRNGLRPGDPTGEERGPR